MRRRIQVIAVVAALSCAAGAASQQARAAGVRFRVSLDPAASSEPVSGRLFIFISNSPKPLAIIEPALGEQPRTVWFAAKEVRGVAPGEAIDIDPSELAWPAPFAAAPAGNYQVMALLDVNHDAAYTLTSAGDLRSAVTAAQPLDPSRQATVDLQLTQRVPATRTTPGPGQAPIDFVSPSLSAFWGRPIHMRGIVVTPPGYAASSDRYPVIYYTHGFTGNLEWLFGPAAFVGENMAAGTFPPFIWVLLDQSTPFGTHEFVDSPNNGPWGHALTTELIPHLERTYRMDARARGRFLNGHSSGGWAALWLQIRYPEFFGGAWPTSPDPVDFRSFLTVDLTTASNLYTRADGTPVTFMRAGGRAVESLREFATKEAVLGDYGGQMASFEAVFSARGGDGRPMALFNRQTGVIDREVAAHWLERYDLSALLVSRWRQLAPRLRRKIHVIVGTADNFYLDESVRLLERAISPFGYDARFTYLPGRDHFDLFGPALDLTGHIVRQMYDVARPGHKWTPRVPLAPAGALTP